MIALYEMSYQKNMKQELVKEMVIALSGTFDFAPFDLEVSGRGGERVSSRKSKAGLVRSILDPITAAGQEPLLDFLGKMYIQRYAWS